MDVVQTSEMDSQGMSDIFRGLVVCQRTQHKRDKDKNATYFVPGCPAFAFLGRLSLPGLNVVACREKRLHEIYLSCKLDACN